jgi:ABC-2 type transport system permease protein
VTTATATATATTGRPARPVDRVASRPFAGTGTLLRFHLRLDRIYIPAWLAGITLLQVGTAASFPGVYPTATDRQIQAAIVGDNPAIRAMAGPGHGLDSYTYGAMVGNELLGAVAVVVALMSVLLLVRHTRAEEEAGRAELVRAGVVGRYAYLASALATVALANVTLGLLVALGLGGLGIESMDWTGSVVYGVALASVGLVFAGIAAVTAQLSAYGRVAAGLAGAAIGVAYGLRALGDVAGNGLSWLSPIGWAQATAPYVDNAVGPLLLPAAATAGLAGIALALNDRRDLAAGLGRQRPGRATGSRWLVTPLGFAWRLQRASLLWWAVAMSLVGLAYGSSVDILEEYADNEVIQNLLAVVGGASLTESWLAMIVGLCAMVCTVFAISAVLHPRREEAAGRAEAVLATALSRVRWAGTHLVVGLAGGMVLLAVTGAALGGAGALVTGDGGLFLPVLAASLAYAPALWVAAGLAAAVYGLAPRATGLAWSLLGYAILVHYLGGLLGLPQWMRHLSPYTHVPAMPVEGFTVWPLLALAALAAGLVAAGGYGLRRRDLVAA